MILCSGAFDGLHSGHVAYLQQAAALDPSMPLVVAIAPDLYIRLHKRREPRWTQTQRAETVAALKCVHRVIEQQALSVADTIRELRPTYFVKGTDWAETMPQDIITACIVTGTCLMYVDTEQRHGADVDWTAIGASL